MEELPLLLVEGTFYEGQELTVSPYSANELALQAAGVKADDILLAYTVSVSGYDRPLTVRARETEKGTLYVSKSGGILQQAAYSRDGSYIVFELDNGGDFVFVRLRPGVIPYIIYGAAGVITAAIALMLIIRARKNAKKNAKENTEKIK